MSETITATAVYVLPPITCDCKPEHCEPSCGTCISSPCAAKRAESAREADLSRRLRMLTS